MKKLLLLGLITFFTIGLTFSQKLVKDETDSFTNSVIKITKKYKVGTGDVKTAMGGLFFKIIREDNRYYIKVSTFTNLGCSGSHDNYIIFKFQDGDTLKLTKDLMDIYCGDNASSLYLIRKETLKRDVISIRIKRSNGYGDYIIKGKYTIQQLIEAVE